MCTAFKAVGLAKLITVVIAILHNGKVPATILPVFVLYACSDRPSQLHRSSPSSPLAQRSSTGGLRPSGGLRRYCRGSAKLFHLKHFSLFQKLKTSNRLHK